MLDPLQNVLDCINVIIVCRKAAKGTNDPKQRMLHFLGEMDYTTELHRQLEELGIKCLTKLSK